MSSKIRCVRKIHFCAGHRVMSHEGKCATVHGHNYYAHLFAEAPQLDALGRVIDFSVLKALVGGWIDQHWDHNFLVCDKDVKVVEMLHNIPRKKDPFICSFNPTAENIADHLLRQVCPLCLEGSGIVVTKVILYETDNCYAEAVL
ncbi:MAG: 6-pyruvoyl trahydropterin synthase family protein [Parachlamydiaceae bacterium]